MNNTAPNVIVIPAKVETPQEQEKKPPAGGRLLPGVYGQRGAALQL